jgi:tetratricopeptide (TPR) repeat protein
LEFSNGSNQDGLRYYAKALDLAELERLTTRERDRIRGLAASDSGDLQVAEDAFRQYTVNYSQDPLGWFYLGYTLIWLGQTDQGLADLRHSYQLNPSSPAIAAQLGMFEAALGNYPQAAVVANHLQLNEAPAFGAYILGLSAFLQGDYAAAERKFVKTRITGPSYDPMLGTALLAHLKAEQGQFAQAAQLLSQGILEDRQSGSKEGESAKLLDRAAMEEKMNAIPAMLNDIEASLRLETDPSSIDNAAFLLGKSLQESPARFAESIRKELTQLDSRYTGNDLGNYSKIAKFRLHAESLLASGRWEAALAEARKAEALEPPISDRSHWTFILMTAADHDSDAVRKVSRTQEAYAAYRRTLLSPGLAWKINFGAPAGFLAEEMTKFLEIAGRLKKQDGDVAWVRNSLTRLRSDSSPPPH